MDRSGASQKQPDHEDQCPRRDFRFKEKGWNHGVGMYQYGMKCFGELDYGYQEILRYYYPDVQRVKLKGFEG